LIVRQRAVDGERKEKELTARHTPGGFDGQAFFLAERKRVLTYS